MNNNVKNYLSKIQVSNAADRLKKYTFLQTDNVAKSAINVKQNFSEFYFNRDFINLVLAVYLGATVQKFFASITQALLPLIIKITPFLKKKETVKVMGKKIKIGKIIVNFISLSISFIVSFVFIYLIVLRGRNKNI